MQMIENMWRMNLFMPNSIIERIFNSVYRPLIFHIAFLFKGERTVNEKTV